MTTWSDSDPRPRPRRIRGGDIPLSREPSWREQRREARRAPASPQFIELEASGGARSRTLGLGMDADGAFAFLLFTALLFIVQLGFAGAAVIALAVPAYLLVRRVGLARVLAPRSFLLIVPLFALLSVVWSEAPKDTFKYALELGVTVIAALLLSSARNPESVLRGIALAFLLYLAVAVATGGMVAIGVGSGGQAFSGLTGSKNLLADIASTGVLVCIVVTVMASRRGNLLWIALGLLGLALGVYAVTAARSAGALLGLAMGLGAMAAVLPLLAVGKAARAWLTAVVGLVVVAVGLSHRWLAQTLIEVGSQTFDKDPTLTGRTYLWYRAADLIHEKPLIGRGYQAFWLQGNTDAEGLWRYFGITERSGFNFHNTGVEILVSLGWVGLVVIATIALIGVIFLVRRFVDRPSLALVLWVSILIYQLARTPIEVIGITPFYFSTVLLFAALGAAFARVAPAAQRARRHVSRRPDIAGSWPVDVTPGRTDLQWSGSPQRLLRSGVVTSR